MWKMMWDPLSEFLLEVYVSFFCFLEVIILGLQSNKFAFFFMLIKDQDEGGSEKEGAEQEVQEVSDED